MQLNATPLLLSLGHGAAPADAADATKPSEDHGFAQLLGEQGDAQAGANPESHGQAAQGQSALSDAQKAVLVAAQEITVAPVTPPPVSAQTITPADATDLIRKIDTAFASDGGHPSAGDHPLWQQLKSGLQDIVDQGTPKSAAQLVEELQHNPDNAHSVTTAATAGDTPRSPTMQRMMQWLQKSLAAKSGQPQESPAQTDAAADASSLQASLAAAQSLPANSFSLTPKDAAPRPKDDKKESSDTIEIMPLSQTLFVPVAAPAITPVASHDLAAIGSATTLRADLDEAIPPLALDHADADALPEIELPDAAASATASVAAKTPARDFLSQLHAANEIPAAATALAANAVPIEKPATKNESDPAAVSITGVGDVGTTGTGSGLAVSGPNAPHAPAAVASAPAAIHTPVADQVQVAISRAAHDKIDHITIQLDPEGLGRVEVRMHTNAAGQTQLAFTVDKADTFDALSRSAHGLERSLQESGIKADTGSMQFNMRQQPQLHADLNGGQNQPRSGHPSPLADASATTGPGSIPLAAAITRHYTLNVRDGVDIHA